MRRQAGRAVRLLRRLIEATLEPLIVVAIASGVELGLRFTTLPRVARLLGLPLALGGASPATQPVVLPRRTAWRMRVVDAVMRRWPWGDTCLRRSLVTGHRLRSLGPVLRLGVRDVVTHQLAAHAWLEIDGGSLDPEADAYAPLVRGRFW
jgi:hypothetical protein